MSVTLVKTAWGYHMAEDPLGGHIWGDVRACVLAHCER